MKRISIFIAGIVVAILVMVGSASASIIEGPSPIAGYGSDDGTELFVPNTLVLNLELFDFGGIATGSTFGFYFEGADVSNAANRITIFGPADESTQGDPQFATINFNTGVVFDNDAAAIQSLFAPSGTNIGFFFSTLGNPVYTQAALNGGLDLSATFPNLTNPATYLIGFEGAQGSTIALEVTNGIRPVPEPSSMLLVGSGLIGLVFFRKRMRRR